MVQLLVIVAALLFFIQVIYLTKVNKLADKQAFIWLVFAILGLVSAAILPSLNSLTIELGIAYPPALIILFAFLIVLSFLVYHTILLSKQEGKVKILIQEVAFLQKELQDFKDERQNK
ncbi:DUF2304 domain-containing protein [Sporosarcina sp. BI001-red]|uniref:DUF2304 domain-containing protein n=1 Tax=Sporosarcina sp. BI001-red TaxID=2282866 RepID=UPI000E27F25F|nr:DUF2304 domain-containing protein [Sporosarcina sp. BI001-red]REB08544.1 DUF2304 domain-containing protein [Sporosarcina sp. BI001-red]